nr:MAG TPA: iron-binding zinc finger protein [Caudoviricetes sp.]
MYPAQHAKASKTKLKMINKVVKSNNPFCDKSAV